jgi:glycosyltransferase involved in cell wall biosynthesis
MPQPADSDLGASALHDPVERHPRLSVVVPTRNRRSGLGDLLDLLVAEPTVGEIIVVDDESSDGTDRYLDERRIIEPRLRRIPGPGQGPLMARVTGVANSTYEIVLLLDDDVRPVEGLCAGHLAHHGPGTDRLVLGYMPVALPAAPHRVEVATRLYAAEYEGRCEEYQKDPDDVLRHLWMGNLSVGRERFLDATSRWPAPLPRFRHEDTEIGLRLASLGVSPTFDPTLLAWHQHRRTLAQFRRDNRLDGAGLAHLDREGRDVFGPPGAQRFSRGLSFPLRQLVVASRRPTAYRVASSALTAATTAAGTVGAVGVETQLARVLRRVERQHGYLRERA